MRVELSTRTVFCGSSNSIPVLLSVQKIPNPYPIIIYNFISVWPQPWLEQCMSCADVEYCQTSLKTFGRIQDLYFLIINTNERMYLSES